MRAVTVGNHIAFTNGECDLESPAGQHLLAHVRQQTGGAISMLPQERMDLEIDPDPELAQYYVFAERGYDTVPLLIHPERPNIVRQALESMSTETCMDLFGDRYQQMASHHIDTERIVDIPAGTDEESVLYRKDVYLGVGPTDSV